jgi:adenine/guanine phosphoribosyltransferase-like PRPP-binding protein
MKSLSEDRDAVASASPQEWPLRVAELARDLEVELGHPDLLLRVADQMLAFAKDHGCQAVVGASRVGSQLAGALVARSTNGLRLFSAADPVESVLVVDGVLATGTQIARAVRVARDAGVKQAAAAVVLGYQEAIEICRDEIDGDIVALDTF